MSMLLVALRYDTSFAVLCGGFIVVSSRSASDYDSLRMELAEQNSCAPAMQ